MRTIKDSVYRPQEKVIKEFVCDGCSESVIQKEMVIPIGPFKGETTIANYGCRCEDKKLVQNIIKQGKQNRMKKLHKIFEQNSLLNNSLKAASFKSYHPSTMELGEIKSRLMTYAKDFNPESGNLLFVGNYGVGKSHLAVAITKQIMTKGFTCLFLSVPKLLTKIRQTYSGGTNFKEADILDLIADVDLFVLDDLGTEYTNVKDSADNWTHTKLFEVLDGRSGKPTIYTTNLTGKQLKEKVNDRNLSRIMDGTEVIEMDGPDYRKRGFIAK